MFSILSKQIKTGELLTEAHEKDKNEDNQQQQQQKNNNSCKETLTWRNSRLIGITVYITLREIVKA